LIATHQVYVDVVNTSHNTIQYYNTSHKRTQKLCYTPGRRLI